MHTTRELLAAVKARHHLASDYQLAKFLGMSKQRISANQAGAVMSDEAALKVADALGLERAHVLAIVAAERAKSQPVKKEWEKLAAATAALFVFAMLPGALPDQAPSAREVALYIMSNAPACITAATALLLALTLLMRRAIKNQ